MSENSKKLGGGGFEGELAERYIDPLVKELGILNPKQKRAYCFGPGRGRELIALGRVFGSVRACEVDHVFFEKSSNVVTENNLNNVDLIEGDATEDLKQQVETGVQYDLIILLGFGPPFKLRAPIIKRSLSTANRALKDNESQIVIASDTHTIQYLQEITTRIWPHGKVRVVEIVTLGVPINFIVLSKISDSLITKVGFPPYSLLEELKREEKAGQKNEESKTKDLLLKKPLDFLDVLTEKQDSNQFETNGD